eukprot:TRINITY_DN1870_c0_g1_i10.p1 TRINITY_DN1870_c0_g1~~TRINITY_DN1870_c0_g1_i10.p1  ORF type:complete len:140 (+),score=27.34 TRINITY_DN1870_c0_g1_i10:52-471(+)
MKRLTLRGNSQTRTVGTTALPESSRVTAIDGKVKELKTAMSEKSAELEASRSGARWRTSGVEKASIEQNLVKSVQKGPTGTTTAEQRSDLHKFLEENSLLRYYETFRTNNIQSVSALKGSFFGFFLRRLSEKRIDESGF